VLQAVLVRRQFNSSTCGKPARVAGLSVFLHGTVCPICVKVPLGPSAPTWPVQRCSWHHRRFPSGRSRAHVRLYMTRVHRVDLDRRIAQLIGETDRPGVEGGPLRRRRRGFASDRRAIVGSARNASDPNRLDRFTMRAAGAARSSGRNACVTAMCRRNWHRSAVPDIERLSGPAAWKCRPAGRRRYLMSTSSAWCLRDTSAALP